MFELLSLPGDYVALCLQRICLVHFCSCSWLSKPLSNAHFFCYTLCVVKQSAINAGMTERINENMKDWLIEEVKK